MLVSSKLKVFIREGGVFELEISGQGEGSTITPLQDIKEVDFGVKPTNQICEKSFTLENKGQRVQLIIWSNMKMKKNKKVLRKEVKST